MSTLTPEQRQILLDGPAGSPPPGQVSNLEDPPTEQIVARVTILSFWILCSICLFIRLCTKIFVIRRINLSDCNMFLAWGVFMGFLTTAWVSNEVAPAADQWNMRLRDLISLLYYFHAGSIMYGIIIFFIKASILLQFLEIFMHQGDYFRWTCHGLIWANFLFYFISTFLEIFACRPLSKAWDLLNTTGSCPVDTNLLNVTASSVNALSDLIILVLPQTRIWKLQMARRKKIAVSAVFLVGALASAASVVRLAYAVLLFTTHNNVSYFGYLAGLWTIPEIACGIIAGSLPATPKFFRSLSRAILASKWGSSLQTLILNSSQNPRTPIGATVEGNPAAPIAGDGAQCKKAPDQYPLTSFASAPGTRHSTSSAALGTEVAVGDPLS
ncbi:hypothetical protein BDV12DRAFT_204625 [Aspergillus spectabilis]